MSILPTAQVGYRLHSTSIPVTKTNIHDYAFLFDMDGTLAPIAATPQAARVPNGTLEILEQLGDACDGAIAIVSGRPVAEIDSLLAPLALSAAGLHGAQWRGPDGKLAQIDIDPAPVAHMAQALAPLVAGHPGLQLEHKGLSLALHYRNAPDFERKVHAAAQAAVLAHADTFVLQPGKMVVEIKPRAASKAGAIQRLMALSPFSGRVPVFAGDDLTDEAGFQEVKKRGGVSIKIGEGSTAADWRMPTPAALARWLASLY